MRYDVLIVGGGAAGLAAACALARADKRVAVLEKQARVGRKLLATGNGRCNLTNLNAAPEYYHGARSAVAHVLTHCPPERVIRFFDELGVPCVHDEEGRVYPRSNQAASVLDALRFAAEERGCELITECAVAELRHPSDFEVRAADGRRFAADRLLIATGGLASPKLGACGDSYSLLEKLGHASAPKFSALAPIRTEAEPVRALKGQRAECTIALLSGGRALRSETGEILFAEYGVSGIAAMQLARACGEELRAGRTCALRIDFLPELADGAAFVQAHAKKQPARRLEDFLNGVVAKRIGMALVKAAGIEPLSRAAGSLRAEECAALGGALKGWTIPVTGIGGFDQAQVTAGGVELKDFHWDTMESKRVPGLYAAGEVLDVDGDCGGFNLQWAWASALVASDAIARAWSENG